MIYRLVFYEWLLRELNIDKSNLLKEEVLTIIVEEFPYLIEEMSVYLIEILKQDIQILFIKKTHELKIFCLKYIKTMGDKDNITMDSLKINLEQILKLLMNVKCVDINNEFYGKLQLFIKEILIFIKTEFESVFKEKNDNYYIAFDINYEIENKKCAVSIVNTWNIPIGATIGPEDLCKNSIQFSIQNLKLNRKRNNNLKITLL